MLALPTDLSAIETQWWDGWKERQEAERGTAIELWDKHRLDTLLRLPDAEGIRNEFLPPFATAEVSSRPVKPLPAGTAYDDMLFIAQLKEAGVGELQAAREEFFNAELLVRDINDKGVEQEVAGLHTCARRRGRCGLTNTTTLARETPVRISSAQRSSAAIAQLPAAAPARVDVELSGTPAQQSVQVGTRERREDDELCEREQRIASDQDRLNQAKGLYLRTAGGDGARTRAEGEA